MAAGGGAGANRYSTAVRVLGHVSLDGEAGDVPNRSPFLRTFLALLAVRPGRVVPIDHLIDELWGERLPQQSRPALQVQATRLRKWLAAAGFAGTAVQNRHDGYVLEIDPSAVDLLRFGAATEACTTAAVTDDPAATRRAADAALAEWGGEPFVGCVLGLDLESERVRAVEQYLGVVERRCQALIDLGDNEAAIAELGAQLPHHRARERLTALAMLALYRSGRQLDALATYADTRRYLVDEYGLEPGPALRRMEAQILNHADELQGGGTAPAVTEPSRRRRARPVIVGRDAELALVAGLLTARELGSMVVVTGEAGAGKTTLATALACDAVAVGAAAGVGGFDDETAPLTGWEEALDELGVDAIAAARSGRDALAGREVRAGLANMARTTPVLVVLEDVHLADTRSLGVLRHLARLGLPPRTVVLLTARGPDAHPHPAWSATYADLARAPGLVELRVPELSSASVAELARLRLGALGTEPTSLLTSTLWDRTSGHPLHLAALLDGMAELEDEDACLTVAREVPRSVRPLIAHQIRSLPGPCRRALEVMAVLGPAGAPEIAAACGASTGQVIAELRPAIDLGVVGEVEDRLSLRHALTAQAVLEGAPEASRRQLHHDRYEALSRRGGEAFAVLRLAVGAGALLSPGALASARVDAARVAYGRGAYVEATELLVAARDDAPQSLVPVVDLYEGLARAALGQAAAAADLLDRVLEAEVLRDDIAITAAVGHEPLGLSVGGDPRRLARLGKVFAADLALDPAHRVELLHALLMEESLVSGQVRTLAAEEELRALLAGAAAHDRVWDARRALVQARNTVEVVDPAVRLRSAAAAYEAAQVAEDHVLRLEATELLLSAALGAGQLERCQDLRWQLQREAQRANRPRSIWSATIVSASLALAAGQEEQADAIAADALDEGLRLGIPDALGAYGVHLVARGLLQGSLADISELIDKASEEYEHIAAWPAVGALARVQCGDADGACERLAAFSCRRAVHDSRYFDRPALALAGASALALGDRAVAETVRRDLPPDPTGVVVVGVGAGVLGPVNLYVALADATLGDARSAREHLDDARRLATDLGWPGWSAVATDLLDRVDDLPPAGRHVGAVPPAGSLPLGLRLLR